MNKIYSRHEPAFSSSCSTSLRQNLDIHSVVRPKWIIFMALHWTKESSSVTKGSHPVSCSYPSLKVWNPVCQTSFVPRRVIRAGCECTVYSGTLQEIDLSDKWEMPISRVISFTKVWRSVIENTSTPVVTYWLLTVKPCETNGFSNYGDVITWLSRSARIKMINWVSGLDDPKNLSHSF